MTIPHGVNPGKNYLINMKLFTTFHLNLSFSSIESEEHKDVIERCYWPLLSLCEIEGVRSVLESF